MTPLRTGRSRRRLAGVDVGPLAERASYTSGVSFGLLSFVAVGVVTLVGSVVTARLYGIELIGAFALAVAPATAMDTLGTLRQQVAFTRELASLEVGAPRITGLFVAVAAFSLGLSALIGLAVLGGAYAVYHGPIGRPDLVTAAAVLVGSYVVVSTTAQSLDSVLAAFRAGRQLFWVRLAQAVVFVAVAVALEPVFNSIWGLVVATIGSSVAAVAHRVIVVRAFMPLTVRTEEIRAGFATLPELIRFGIRLVPGTIADGITHQAGVWIIGAYSSVAQVGGYSRAWTISARLMDVKGRIAEMLFPTLVFRRASGDRAGHDVAFVDSIRYAMMALLLMAAALGSTSREVMGLFGPGFSSAAPALALLAVVPALSTASSLQAVVLYSANRPLITSVLAVGRLVVALPLAFLLVPAQGASGAAVSLVAAHALGLVIATALTRRELSVPIRSLWRPRQAASIPIAYAGAMLAGNAASVSLPEPAALVGGLVASSLVFLMVLRVVGGFEERDRMRLSAARRAYTAYRNRSRLA